MSYWYQRLTKRNVLILLATIPLLLISGMFQLLGTYTVGCVPTASRTLYDWISPERGFNSFEVYPYVALYIDTGCIEWLGFSTCEVAQFKDWMPIWTQGEDKTLHIMNISEATQDIRSLQPSEIHSPVQISYAYSDDGTMASTGQLVLKRSLKYTHDLDASRLDEIITAVVPGAAGAGVIVKHRLSDVLGLTNAGGWLVYLDLRDDKQQETFVLPSPTNKQLTTNSLYYYLSTNKDSRRCDFDDDCAQHGCTWKGSCEPQGFGHGGIVLPSATFFFDVPGFSLGHWPQVAWRYSNFCPQEADDCLVSKTVVVFQPATFSRAIFQNTLILCHESNVEGFLNKKKSCSQSYEKFPDLWLHKWKQQGYERRKEGCAGSLSMHSRGKDCDVPPDYTFAGNVLFFVTLPATDGDVSMPSVIYTEKVTGLRIDYQIVWQMNSRVLVNEPNGQERHLFIPLYWVEHHPAVYKLSEHLDFASFGGYGNYILEIMMASWIIYVVTQGVWLYVFLVGISCTAYLRAVSQQNAPFLPQYV